MIEYCIILYNRSISMVCNLNIRIVMDRCNCCSYMWMNLYVLRPLLPVLVLTNILYIKSMSMLSNVTFRISIYLSVFCYI
ncbi:hypothetical protein RchiOBHm_Chr2g0134021 [Rosa chinensis]|uniref:Uncharacterized protein n=1 Tax=Rosa chinensis TaxID=74649 RepID=A0A2P6RVQ8_ROSCH|nr:hypothetical protein RchiOBHm_Chr2g0134021 [Rosa chinensis]